MIVPRYSYRIDSAGQIVERVGGEATSGVGKINLDGVQRPIRGVGTLRTAERDLLRVAAAILCADRLSPRRSRAKRRLLSDLAWQRSIQLQVAVEQPDLWSSAEPILARLLTFMTDDNWQLQFDRAHQARLQQVLFSNEIERPREIALFSGGLDSVAGVYVRGLGREGKLCAVSAVGNDVRQRAQTSAIARLRSEGIQVDWVGIEHQLRSTTRGRNELDATQRSRSLLFLAMGAVVATRLELSQYSVYETGIGGLNIPFSPAQVASQGTRAMHPLTLSLVNDLLSVVLPDRVRVVMPFFFHTKAGLCRDVGGRLSQLVSVAMSCDEGEGHKPDSMQHCGLCTSCLFRRIAIHAAGQGPDLTRYRDAPTRQHGEYEIQAFAYQAAELAKCKQFGDLLAIDANVQYASSVPMEEEVPSDEVRAGVMNLYRAYTKEVSTYLETARPILRQLEKHPKERICDLFSTIG